MEKKKVKRFSPSKLTSCQVKYYLTYIEPFKFIILNYPIVIGRIVHLLLEYYFKDYEQFKSEKNKEKKVEELKNLLYNKELIISLIIRQELLTKVLYEEEFIKDENIIFELKNDEFGKNTNEILEILKTEPWYLYFRGLQNNILKIVNTKMLDKAQDYFSKSKYYVEDKILKVLKNSGYEEFTVIPEVPVAIQDNTVDDIYDILLYGKLDLLIESSNLEKEKKIFLIDFKTGKHMPGTFQIALYGYILLSMFRDFNLQNLSLTLLYVNPNTNSVKRIISQADSLLTRFNRQLKSKIKSYLILDKNFKQEIKIRDYTLWYENLSQLELFLQTQEKYITGTSFNEREENFKIFMKENYGIPKENLDKFFENLYVISNLLEGAKENFEKIKCKFCEFKSICPLYSSLNFGN